MVYPHIISIFNKDMKCDFCANNNSKIIEIAKDVGYYCCQEDTCKKMLENNIQTNVIAMDKLKNMFGDNIKVKRSTGEIESDWVIVSPGYITNAKSSHTIKVRKNNSYKELRFNDIESLNN
jgi:hypothetical protein